MTFDTIKDKFPNMRFVKDVDLSVHSSMKTGGTAHIAMFPETKNDLIDALIAFNENNMNYSIIGNASNILFKDEGYDDRIIIFTSKMKNCEISGNRVSAECGVSLTSLALNASKAGLSGLEFAYGIPGTVGGAVYMNAGAYGGEMSDIIVSTEYFDLTTGKVESVVGKDHLFGYRNSVFHSSDKIILSTNMELSPCKAEDSVALCEENMGKRISKQPLKLPSCGSAFKRPEGHFAGALIEQCGLKGFSVGGAQVSEMHAGFVVNVGGATTSDVVELLNVIRQKVMEKFGVMLEPEIMILE